LEARAKILEILRRKNYSKNLYPGKLNTSVFSDKGKDNLLDLFVEQAQKVNAEVEIISTEDEIFSKIKEYLRKNNLNNIYTFIPELQQYLSDNAFKPSNEFSKDIEIAVTRCENLIARTGTALLSSAYFGRKINYFAEYHIVIAKESQIVWDISEAIENLQAKFGKDLPSMISLVTGPSRTADIEKTLILGAHGPKKLKILILKQ